MYPLRIENLTIELPNGQTLVSDLTFGIQPGEVLVLMGPSGSGKSSILAWLTGTADPGLCASGEVWLGDTRITALPTERRRLGLMLQQDYLFPHMTVQENLLFGLRVGKRSERLKQVSESLQHAGLADMEHRDPATLSGGQRARVSLVRTLLSNPCALLLDEPFSRLDSTLREQIRRFTWDAAVSLPVLLVTHDASDIPADAKILEIGSAATSALKSGRLSGAADAG